MDKRGIFLFLVVIFSLAAIGYAFAHGEHCSSNSDCSGCHPCESGHCDPDSVWGGNDYLDDGDRCTGLASSPCVSVNCASDNCYNDPSDSYSYGRCRSNSYWMGLCGSYTCNNLHTKCVDAPGGSVLPNKTCAFGYYCGGAGCWVKKVNGQACTADYVCISNNCVAGECVPAGPRPDGSDCDVNSDCASSHCIQTGGSGNTPRCLTPVIGNCPENDDGLACGCAGPSRCRSVSAITEDCVSSLVLSIPCADGYMCVNDESGRGSCVLEPGDLEDGQECSEDADCQSTDCYLVGAFGPALCRSDNYWIAGCGVPSACIPGSNYTRCEENPGGITSPDRTCAPGYYCEQIYETRVACHPKLANDEECSFDQQCVSGFCDETRAVCTSGEIPEVPCLVPSDCSEGSTCVEGECQEIIPTTCTIDDEGEDCDSNDICNPITEECETAHDCVTTTSCESQGLEGYSCFTSEPGEGVCRPSVGTDPDDNDEDNDGVDDDVDPCVGSSSDCDAPDSGSSCEGELNGLVCDPGDECLGGTYSAVSTELNCCAGVNPSCSRVSLAVALGTSIRYIRACSSTNGEALVTVTSPGGADLTSDQCLAIGVNTNQLVPSTPFKCQYKEQDWNCGELNLLPEPAGPSVFGYGLIGLLITIGIVIGFYFTRNRKLRFI